ncbi:MAG: MoxR family ATPase [Candidatus Bathyarchaeia archaeon]
MEELKRHLNLVERIREELNKVVIGKSDLKEALLVAMISGGHVLIEGLPGTGKTLLARSFAKVIGGEFKRIQFTADMLPTDVMGFYMYRPDGSSKLIKGPVFANVVLADELNRSTPRTQAALIEAMQEGQVSIEGVTYDLPKPFMVMASQLPYGYEGTYPLTEVQIDRFMLRVWSGYPSMEEEMEIVKRIDYIEEFKVETVARPEDVIGLQMLARKIYVSDKIVDYITSLVAKLRGSPDVVSGPSPRATIALYKGSRSLALIEGRDFVIPDDVKRLAPLVLEHRIKVKPEAEIEGITARRLVEEALKEVPVPKIAQ